MDEKKRVKLLCTTIISSDETVRNQSWGKCFVILLLLGFGLASAGGCGGGQAPSRLPQRPAQQRITPSPPSRPTPQGLAGLTELMIAAERGQTERVRILLNQGANINERAGHRPAAQQATVLYSSDDTEKLFNCKDASSQYEAFVQEKYSGMTALMLAAKEGHSDIVQMLLNRAATVNIQSDAFSEQTVISEYNPRRGTGGLPGMRNYRLNQCGATALMLAASNGHLAVVQKLIEGGASVNIKDAHGNTALSLAENRGHVAIVDFLRKTGATR